MRLYAVGRNTCVYGKWNSWKHATVVFRFSGNSDCGVSWYSENGQSFVENVFIEHNGS